MITFTLWLFLTGVRNSLMPFYEANRSLDISFSDAGETRSMVSLRLAGGRIERTTSEREADDVIESPEGLRNAGNVLLSLVPSLASLDSSNSSKSLLLNLRYTLDDSKFFLSTPHELAFAVGKVGVNLELGCRLVQDDRAGEAGNGSE